MDLGVDMSIMLHQLIKVQLENLVFVLPRDLGFRKPFRLLRGRRRICDFGYQVCRASFGDAIDQNTEHGDLEDEIKADSETYYTRVRGMANC